MSDSREIEIWVPGPLVGFLAYLLLVWLVIRRRQRRQHEIWTAAARDQD